MGWGPEAAPLPTGRRRGRSAEDGIRPGPESGLEPAGRRWDRRGQRRMVWGPEAAPLPTGRRRGRSAEDGNGGPEAGPTPDRKSAGLTRKRWGAVTTAAGAGSGIPLTGRDKRDHERNSDCPKRAAREDSALNVYKRRLARRQEHASPQESIEQEHLIVSKAATGGVSLARGRIPENSGITAAASTIPSSYGRGRRRATGRSWCGGGVCHRAARPESHRSARRP